MKALPNIEIYNETTESGIIDFNIKGFSVKMQLHILIVMVFVFGQDIIVQNITNSFRTNWNL